MIRAFKLLRSFFFAFNLICCILMLVLAIQFPSVLGISINDSLGLTLHIAIMIWIFISTFLLAVFHQLHEQERIRIMHQNRY